MALSIKAYQNAELKRISNIAIGYLRAIMHSLLICVVKVSFVGSIYKKGSTFVRRDCCPLLFGTLNE